MGTLLSIGLFKDNVMIQGLSDDREHLPVHLQELIDNHYGCSMCGESIDADILLLNSLTEAMTKDDLVYSWAQHVLVGKRWKELAGDVTIWYF